MTIERFGPDDVDGIASALFGDGAAVVEGAVDVAHVDVLAEALARDLPAVLDLEHPPFNFTWGHLQQDAPRDLPHLFRDVLANDTVAAALRQAVGGRVRLSYYSGNTNLPDSILQPVHVDEGHLWADVFDVPPAAVGMNVPLVDVDDTNGPIEVWPGTHRLPGPVFGVETTTVSRLHVDTRSRVVPPVTVPLARGDILLRDVRLWHRGTPNTSDVARPMLALVYRAPWMRLIPGPLVFPTDSADFFADLPVDITPVFSDDGFDHITANRSYGFPD